MNSQKIEVSGVGVVSLLPQGMHGYFLTILIVQLSLFVSGGIVEENFLKSLDVYIQKFGNQLIIPFQTRRVIRKDREEKLDNYKKTLDSDYVKMVDYLNKSVKKNNSIRHDQILKTTMRKTKPLNAVQLKKYFKTIINQENFTIQNGDIVFILPKTWTAFQYAHVIDSKFEHMDMIYTNEHHESFVIEISRGFDLTLVPLAEYLLGASAPNTRFAIYRYKKNIDHILMKQILDLIVKNRDLIYYDPYFKRDHHYDLLGKNGYQQSQFFYCGELIYAVYKTLLNHDDWIGNQDSLIMNFLERRFKKNVPLNDAVKTKVFEADRNKNQSIVIPQFFTHSKDFKCLARQEE